MVWLSYDTTMQVPDYQFMSFKHSKIICQREESKSLQQSIRCNSIIEKMFISVNLSQDVKR